MYGAGTISGLLGVGSGALKVPAMDLAMGLPIKVSTATSAFMIGVTAAASAGVHFSRDLIDAHANYTASVGSVLKGTAELRGQSIVMLGVLVLIATPVVRVAASVVLFAAERDRMYVAITTLVLLLLIVSFVIGAAE